MNESLKQSPATNQQQLLLLTFWLGIAGALTQVLLSASSIWYVIDFIHAPDASPPPPAFVWLMAAIINVPIVISILLQLGLCFWGLKRKLALSALGLFTLGLLMSTYTTMLFQLPFHWIGAMVELLLAISSGFLWFFIPRRTRGFAVSFPESM
jgi:hypothetical protein